MATKKKAVSKKTSARKSPAKKKSSKTSAKGAPKKAAAKRKSAKKSGGALQNVARSIGSTLGSFAKKTSEVVDAAKNALPFGSDHENPEE